MRKHHEFYLAPLNLLCDKKGGVLPGCGRGEPLRRLFVDSIGLMWNLFAGLPQKEFTELMDMWPSTVTVDVLRAVWAPFEELTRQLREDGEAEESREADTIQLPKYLVPED